MHSSALKIVGIMSGTSLDGLDLALCHFYKEDHRARFKLLASKTIPYEPVWKKALQQAYQGSAENYFKLHASYGDFIATNVRLFLDEHSQQADYIASHGHTIFHQPALGFSTQIGCGSTIAAQTGIPTVCDFRSIDVALGGQGAPLVPIGDRDLFGEDESCLNLGGIANISFTKNNHTVAFDICIANMALNHLMESIGKTYDEDGKMASTGKINERFLKQLMALNTENKSLGREWFELYFLPILSTIEDTLENKLATCVEYTILKVNQCLDEQQLKSVFITGGGVYNTYLIERLSQIYSGHIKIPADEIIQFKEAIIFAYLGYLKATQQNNTLSSVTGASQNSNGGCMYSVNPHQF